MAKAAVKRVAQAEIRAAKKFLERRGLKSDDVSPRKFAMAAKELDKGFADTLKILARELSGGRMERRRQGAARKRAQRARAARRVHCNRGGAVVHESAGVGERCCDEVVQRAACECRKRAPREPCARARLHVAVVAGRAEQPARDDTRV